MDEPLDTTSDYERVDPAFRCPRCGEDDVDQLVWDENEMVSCANCGNIYDPLADPSGS